MSASGLESLNHSLQMTHRWINELDAALGWHNKARSYRLLRTVLQSLRDCLPLGEAGDFAAQLPVVLRGVFYEQWRPASSDKSRWTYDRLLGRVDEAERIPSPTPVVPLPPPSPCWQARSARGKSTKSSVRFRPIFVSYGPCPSKRPCFNAVRQP
jgi:uncharacterized protein (DUF2267 family)